MKKNLKNGFTLVELLAVIVILAIILVIAVPKVMSVIEDSKKATLESTAKMIASSAEKQKVQNTVLGKGNAITCDSVAKINKGDYANCNIDFDNNTAKVTIEGKGKFEGLYVCNGTKTTAVASAESCTPVINAVSFEDDDWTTIVAAVQSGNHPYEVGDTKTIDLGDDLGEHAIRVANTTPCDGTLASETACGFVLEFADIITRHEMNGDPVNYTDATNVGGWPASEMRAYLNDLDANDTEDGVIYNAIPEELRAGIIDTTVVSGHGSTTGEENFTSMDKLYLLSTEEVWAQEDSNTIDYDTSRGTSRQLDYYANNNVSTTNYSVAIKTYGEEGNYWWWLRSANSSYVGFFFRVTNTGDWSFTDSYNSSGVSPAFRIG